ncbi:putative oxidoreductase [Gordonia effusa NBRC 100432]|uniref:Putative oxidoreductase n=1 Tax=Gordonia effusa NBRC 100432 TaxID=1077974 RepID=H0QUZ6_9ACTN|nr:SDR family oxidoreductase [Gordonia effusa]GAB16647.1 putative oxidoreductase [Gordonia effusa NBRC 100432]
MGLFGRRVPRIDVANAVVVITGGARGIGAATAAEFARQGATVWIGDVDGEVASTTAAALPGASAAPLDVTDPQSWATFVDKVIANNGRIDVLVNNAGVMPVGPFEAESTSITELILDVNVAGVLNGMRAVLPTMLGAKRGHIVNIASMAGMLPLPGMVSYNASKYAALGASLAARLEYGDAGVAVCAILPAAVRTELSSGADLGGTLPTVDPEDVARAVVKTLRTQAARTSVPGWVAPLWALTDLFVPEFLERIGRRFANDRQALALDAAERRDYLERVDRQAAQHGEETAKSVKAKGTRRKVTAK